MEDFESIENDDRTAELARHISEILSLIGEDANREGLLKTPERVAKVFQFLTSGQGREDTVQALLSSAIYSSEYDEMVLMKDIEFCSLCEHHLLPFYGKVHVAYLPDKKVIGLSKIPRLVEVYARRLQIQERMTIQIKEALQNNLQPKGVGVLVEASHMCMMIRGVQKLHSTTITSSLSGEFLNDARTRAEFLKLVQG